MNFLILSHVHHIHRGGKYYAYGPYVREMNIWIKFFSSVTIIAPLSIDGVLNPIDLPYEHDNIRFLSVHEINLTSWSGKISTILSLPATIITTVRAMRLADHIHLRCPGNMGLLGAFLQWFFPGKNKTAKYAGNWDPSSSQPYTYKLQQRLISDPGFSKNMHVLTYGNWPNQTGNIVPFFTFSYESTESQEDTRKPIEASIKLKLLFVGALVKGKNPLMAAEVGEVLAKHGVDFELEFCGEGAQKEELLKFIEDRNLTEKIKLCGNVTSETLKSKYKASHFLIFLSESEGWPKVVAESMFFGCLPITTPVSCVADMLGYGERGDLIDFNPPDAVNRIKYYIEKPEEYKRKSKLAKEWSRGFTKESFELELQKLINHV
ncbi:Glycosyltransferase involved in cell wall bisynthesis [Algoriphagus locisalis]|uniref:Glycosyltransferase involved in cell wall bisynthesis n=1 Tax=Algoriphagus locisalis TaxID=305507 RepID=A0A1I6XRJ6_9BACT|nr:glycosyltransferase [Algoriphagus locisalis]SFT40324.1 Glycosyltransferase involved in cell wall bisynthesis [Algoriphagus locisalis]